MSNTRAYECIVCKTVRHEHYTVCDCGCPNTDMVTGFWDDTACEFTKSDWQKKKEKEKE